MDGLLDAVQFAHGLWKLQASFSGIRIHAVSAIGLPGCLKGPDLENSIKSAPSVASWKGAEAAIRNAFAKAVGGCFKQWQAAVTVPGLPWYPAFSAWPGPDAPPMPNVPTPLVACASSKVAQIVTPGPMKSSMLSGLKGDFAFKDQFCDALAFALALAFQMWLPTQMVMLVLGKGPVPTFAPPYVPVGPVVNGSVIPTPGHLLS